MRRSRARGGYRGRIHLWGPFYLNFGKRGYTSTSIREHGVTRNNKRGTTTINTPGHGSVTFYD